jgi:CubicO group peptidase (beta-lactamase class C family)
VRVAIDVIRKYRDAGGIATADQYPYVASSTSLSATFLPTWARAGGRETTLERLQDDDDAKRIHEAIRRKLELTGQGQRIQIASCESEPTWTGRRLKEIADEQGLSPLDLILHIERNGGAKIVNFGINEEDVRYVMQQPWVATASDGSSLIPSEDMPHPRNYGTFPRKIGYYSVREGVVPLEHAIRSASGLPADILGLKDRGYLRVGYLADVAVWSEQELIDRATFEAPHGYSEGIKYLFVNGTPAIWQGHVTGALAGRSLRHEPKATGEAEIAAVSQILRRYMPEERDGGVAVLVTKSGTVVHCRGYGTVRGTEDVTSRTKLSLASVAKQFAAMCAVMLIEEGKLDLQAKVSQYLPELHLPTTGREVLLQDLIWHTSGLPNFINKKEKNAIEVFKKQHGLEFLNNETHAQWLATMESRRPPGQEYEYTNSGYVLLARIIEVVSGKPFHVFQQERIFDVLGMEDTTDSQRFNGSGNMRTTLEDYAKWDRALWQQDERLLCRRGFQMIFRRGTLDSGTPVDYGFGWKLKYGEGGLEVAEHGGWGSGTTAARNMVKRYFDDEITVAVFGQEYPDLGRRTEDGRSVREVVCDEIHQSVRKSDSSTALQVKGADKRRY